LLIARAAGGIGCRWCVTPLMSKRTPSEPVGTAAWRRLSELSSRSLLRFFELSIDRAAEREA
jgi:hypothetical protein